MRQFSPKRQINCLYPKNHERFDILKLIGATYLVKCHIVVKNSQTNYIHICTYVKFCDSNLTAAATKMFAHYYM